MRYNTLVLSTHSHQPAVVVVALQQVHVHSRHNTAQHNTTNKTIHSQLAAGKVLVCETQLRGRGHSRQGQLTCQPDDRGCKAT